MNDTIKLNQQKPKKKIELTYERQKMLWAIVFLLPWIVGLVIFFIVPFFESLVYSFYKLTPQVGFLEMEYKGIENYLWVLNSHTSGSTSFKVELVNTIQDVLINIPVLLIFSLFIAVLLNMKFKGRAIVRSIFFIPVILNSAAVTSALAGNSSISDIMNQQGIGQIFDLQFYLLQAGIPDFLVAFVVGLIDRIYDILTHSGVPILLFLAAIQSIPSHLYEAAKIEGATSYEQFWLITLPNVTPHLLTVIVYALIDTFLTSSVSNIIAETLKGSQYWGEASAMAWIYVIAILAILSVVVLIFKIFKIGDSHYES
ncbi:carbohydrate ABC transporter permease [Acholeplasma equifetale]|uniref:carbohydrate ABC transporter permease n=1 Tax=Acholeplasma equifetale TaxID=264634 RepID=UPI0005546A5C|nr:sugar ABC transporter permease [Acholeplasma equifetale]